MSPGTKSRAGISCQRPLRSTRTTGSGKDRRTETVYTCALVGHGEAIKGARRWAESFVRVFGDLPDYPGVLEQWELWRLGALAGTRGQP